MKKNQFNNIKNLHFSLYSNLNLKYSIRYLYYMALNIKQLIEYQNYFQDIYFIIHTDELTKNILIELCHNENIELNACSKIIFKIYKNSAQTVGMFWRFKALYDDTASISLIAEADFLFTKEQLYVINCLESINNICCTFQVNKKLNKQKIVLSALTGFKPNLIPSDIKNIFKKTLEDDIFNRTNLRYGDDEIFLSQFFLKYFKSLNNYIVLSPGIHLSSGNKLTSADYNEQLVAYKQIFFNSIINVKENFKTQFQSQYSFKTKDLKNIRIYNNCKMYLFNNIEFNLDVKNRIFV